ncbi:MAG: STAS domain-containing protein [Omnitrophica WOR_2 bacterium]
MENNSLSTTVRKVSPFANVIDIHGAVNSFTEKTLVDAYTQAIEGNIRSVILNFNDMTYMNSFGIGMLVMLLIRAKREGKSITGFGLSDHYKTVFELTRLDQAIPIYENESTALATAAPMDLPEREY